MTNNNNNNNNENNSKTTEILVQAAGYGFVCVTKIVTYMYWKHCCNV